MIFLMLALGLILVGPLLLVLSFRPRHSGVSLYELRRRKELGDKAGTEALRRVTLLAQVEALRLPLITLLLGLLVLLATSTGGLWWGLAITLIVAFMCARLASLPLLQRRTQKLYLKHETGVLSVLERRQKLFSLLTGRVPPTENGIKISSKEELIHSINGLGTILSHDEIKLLSRALSFTHRRAQDVMTGRDDLVTIEHTEMIGPLVLSDLHKSGHSCFPVISKTPDHIVGMLDIRGLLTLETKRSLTAAKAMTGPAYYIRGEQMLDHTLAAFIRTRSHLLVVIDGEGATLGLLSLRDVLEALFGRGLADEFAGDSDVRHVSARQL